MSKRSRKIKIGKELKNKKTIFVPLHSENWALALSQGYLGYPPSDDAIKDMQARYPNGVIGFEETPPGWAMQCDEPGAMVVLKVESYIEGAVEEGGIVILPGLQRVSRVVEAIFASQSELDNFIASYAAFPDVPVDLVPVVVSTQSNDLFGDKEVASSFTVAENPDKIEFETRDAFCGWSARLIDLIEGGEYDDEIERYFSRVAGGRGSNQIMDHARELLHAFDPNASEVDESIWSALVKTTMNSRASHGFDRRQVIDQVEAWLRKKDKIDTKASTWLEVAADVVSARREPPPLTDEGSLGQRASLAFLIAHEPEAVDYLEAGSKVRALVSILSSAYLGYARANASLKKPKSKLDAVLGCAEALEGGKANEVTIDIGRLDGEMNEHDTFALNGEVIAQRARPVSPYRLMLRARALEAGMQLLVDEELGCLYVDLGDSNDLKIFIDEDPSSRPDQPVVRFWAPLMEMKARTPSAAAIKKLLEKSWLTGCALGVNQIGDKNFLCAFVTQLTNTLDRDEFDAHVDHILKMTSS